MKHMIYTPFHFKAYETKKKFGHWSSLNCIDSIRTSQSNGHKPRRCTAGNASRENKIQISNRNLAKVQQQVLLLFSLARRSVEDTFCMPPTKGTIMLRTSFFELHSVTLDLKNHFLHLPGISMQLRKISTNRYLKSFSKIEHDADNSDPAVPTSDLYPSEVKPPTLLRTAPWKQHPPL